MTTEVPTRRYAKGDAKRRQILDAALHVISERGYRHSSLQEIADSVDLTKAGVLHYFDSREDLLTQVLREKDALDDALRHDGDDLVDLMREAIEHNQHVPGLVQLYSRLAVETEDPGHPGHAYVGDRYATITAELSKTLQERQASGSVRSDVDPEVWARLLAAISDGLQLQWIHDPTLDMRATYDAAMQVLRPDPEA